MFTGYELDFYKSMAMWLWLKEPFGHTAFFVCFSLWVSFTALCANLLYMFLSHMAVWVKVVRLANPLEIRSCF